MRKILITFLLIFTIGHVSAQIPKDTITLKHSAYTTLWSSTLDYPLLVQWWNTKESCNCGTPIPRKGQFAADPLLIKETNIQFEYEAANKSQRDKGLKVFDRGHMSPVADNQCSITDKGKKIPAEVLQKESFYFTNIAPQYHSLNAGDWKKLEERTRQLTSINDSIYVWCGSVGTQIILSGLAIPVKCWKVIYIKKTKTYECYIFNNTPDKPVGLDKWKVTKEEVEKLTGFKFNL